MSFCDHRVIIIIIIIIIVITPQLATVTGWGTLQSGGNQPATLQEVDVTVTTNADCAAAYGSDIGP